MDTKKLEFSQHYWDCECEGRYIHHNMYHACFYCFSRRDSSPPSRLDEVKSGNFFTKNH